MKLNLPKPNKQNPNYLYPLTSTSSVHFQAYFSSSMPTFLYLETAICPFSSSEKPLSTASLQGSSSQVSQDSSHTIPVDNVPKNSYLSTPESLLCQKTETIILFPGRPPGFILYPERPLGCSRAQKKASSQGQRTIPPELLLCRKTGKIILPPGCSHCCDTINSSNISSEFRMVAFE